MNRRGFASGLLAAGAAIDYIGTFVLFVDAVGSAARIYMVPADAAFDVVTAISRVDGVRSGVTKQPVSAAGVSVVAISTPEVVVASPSTNQDVMAMVAEEAVISGTAPDPHGHAGYTPLFFNPTSRYEIISSARPDENVPCVESIQQSLVRRPPEAGP